MRKLVLKKGTKEEKEYLLDLSFNAIVDTDAMEKLEEADKIVKSMNAYNQAMSKVKKGGKVPDQLANYNQTAKLREFLKILRSLLFICLQDNHEEEIKSEKDAGTLISKLCEKKEYDLFGIFDVVTDCIKDCDFLSGETEEPETQENPETPTEE